METPRIGRWRVLGVLALVLVSLASSSVNAALSDACSASLENLFPPQFNVTAIKRDLDNAEAAVKKVVPSPLTGFTLFLPADTALSNATGNSNNKAIAGQLQKGIGTAKAVSYWLYNMLAQPLSSDQLLIRGREATQLSAVVNSSAYDLRFVLPGQLRTSQVTVNGLLDNPARILSSFQVCSSWVHVVDAILWPSANATLDSIPDPAPGGKFAVGQQQSFPTADNLWYLLGSLPSLPRLGTSSAATPQNSFPARSLIDLPPLPPDLARSPTAALSTIPQATGIGLPPTPDDSSLNPPNPQRAINTAVLAISNGINSAINTVQGNMPGAAQSPSVSMSSVQSSAPAPAPIGGLYGTQQVAAAAGNISGSGSANNTGAIVGGVVAAVVVLCAVAALAAWLMRKRRIRNSGSSDEESPYANNKQFKDNNGFPHGQNGIKDSAYSASSALSQDISMQPYIKRAGTDDSGFLALYNDMEYHVEPRLIMSSSTRDGDFMQQLALRSRTSMGTGSMSPEVMEWEILPEDIIICKDPYGRDWQLGTGGFGSVYKGIWQGNTPVAVKFVTGHSPKEQQRFRNEVAILKSLRHVNIVQFLGASLAGDQIMLVTEYMPRGDLWRALSQDSVHHFAWRNMGWQVALHIARGLHHMHSRKVMHLDLKSANILLARDGTAKVADVGLAKILTRDNTHVSMEGTFDWAAPEVLAGQECSEKADMWSLGVVLWEIVTGERPHLRQLRPVRVPEECPQEVADAINACRQLDANARPTALEICNIIEASAPRCSLSSTGSMPPGPHHDGAEVSRPFPTRDPTEPPTSDDLAYVPMSSLGPESSLEPPSTVSLDHRGGSLPARGSGPAFPSPFAASSHPEPERPGTAPAPFSESAAEEAQSLRTASTSAIAASPFANSAVDKAESESGGGMQRSGSPAHGTGRSAATVAAGLPSVPSAPLTERPEARSSVLAPVQTSDRAAASSRQDAAAAARDGTSSPSISGILTALPHRGLLNPAAAVGLGRPPLGGSPRAGASPRLRGGSSAFAQPHSIPEEGEQQMVDDNGVESTPAQHPNEAAAEGTGGGERQSGGPVLQGS